jgi:hypothetical protein
MPKKILAMLGVALVFFYLGRYTEQPSMASIFLGMA